MSKRTYHADKGKLARRVGRLEDRQRRDLVRLKAEMISSFGHIVEAALFRASSTVSVACVGCGERWLAGDIDEFQKEHAEHGAPVS